MQLSHTRIAIRERSYWETLDLALRVIRVQALPLLVALVAGAAPAIALNHWLLGPVDPEIGHQGYWFGALALAAWEMPLATAAMTLWLGQAVFSERPSARRVVTDLLGSLGQLVWYEVLLRGVMIVLLPAWLILFARQPYLNEVLLLERNPFWRRSGITTGRRSRAMHAGLFGELFLRWLGSLAAGLVLGASLWLSMWAVRGQLFSEWQANEWMLTLGFQSVLWLVLGYFTVARFLSYLDLRIRREGWEVELLLRDEAARLERLWKQAA
jgi:hypothetical protein